MEPIHRVKAFPNKENVIKSVTLSDFWERILQKMDKPENRCGTCGTAICASSDDASDCPDCLTGLMGLAFPENTGSQAGQGIFANYELLEELARGGMGVVYRAHDLRLNREVALKMIVSGSIADTEVVERFEREARAVAMLDHPNIAPIYEIGEFEGQHFFAMRLITDIMPLREMGLRSGDLSGAKAGQRKIAECMLMIADAIQYAHARGVIHCDLKPSNILLDSGGQPHLTDFGLARVLEGGSIDLTRTRVIAGTPGYMAPEQASGQGDITVATDVYGLGAVLYELLTGHPPHVGESAYEVLLAIVEEPVKHVRTVNPAVDRDFATIAEKCLRKDPEKRYPSARGLMDDLRSYLAGDPISARPVTALEVVARSVRKYPAISVLAAMLTLSVVAGLLFFIRENRKVASSNAMLTESVSQLEWKEMVARGESGRRIWPWPRWQLLYVRIRPTGGRRPMRFRF